MADGRKIAMGCAAGCAVIAGLMAVSAGACGVWVWREGQRMQEEMTDPAARGDKVLEVLGTDRVPDGYFPLAAFSVPFVARMAMLTDRSPDADGEVEGFDERGFVYFETIGVGQDEQQLHDFFEGRTDDYSVLEDNGLNFDIEEALGRGVFDLDPAQVMYVTQRGSIAVQGNQGDGLTGVALIDCPEDERRRVAVWFGPDVEAQEGETEDLAGTPADPAALRAFLANFSFCAE